MAKSKVFDASSDGTILIVVPSGSVGSLAGDDVNFELEDLLKQIDESELKHVVFDFRSVAYFGSSMLGAMHAIWKHVHSSGGKMALCNLSDVEREVLQVSRFDTLWGICDSREEALAAVTGTQA